MKSFILNSLSVQAFIGLLIVLGMIFCIFPPDHILFKSGANFTVQIMLVYLALGLVFLALRQKNLMFVSFLSCAVLCLFLRESFDESQTRSFYPKLNQERKIEIAHFNVSAFNDDYEQMLKVIRESEVDLVSIQEVTPDWNFFLREGLAESYPFSKTVVRIDFHGLAVYSKHPFIRIDTFHFEEIPNIIGSIEVDSTHGEVFFVTSHTEPPVSQAAYQRIEEHMGVVASIVSKLKAPVFTMGDYNVVPWSVELQAFRLKSKLNNSRRNFTPTAGSAAMPFFDIPIDHIFYSDDFQCVSFGPVSNETASVGIRGKFQFKYKYVKGSIK